MNPEDVMNTSMAARPKSSESGAREEKYLSFRLGREEYGVEILRVREIIGMIDVTPLPHAPAHVRGVVNLRGRIIPVVDLRALFGMASAEATPQTCIVFVEVASAESGAEGEKFQIGMVVDGVSEVMGIERGKVEDPPRFGGLGKAEFISGIGKVGEQVILLLNLDRALGASAAAAASAPGEVAASGGGAEAKGLKAAA